jgi:hypothetical protein
VAALRRESGPLNLSDPDQARAIEGYRRATQEYFHGASVTAVAVRSEPLIEDPREYGSTMTATFDVMPPSGASNPETTADPFAAQVDRLQRGEPPPETGAARIRIDASVVWM